jgi:hypothetical protein
LTDDSRKLAPLDTLNGGFNVSAPVERQSLAPSNRLEPTCFFASLKNATTTKHDSRFLASNEWGFGRRFFFLTASNFYTSTKLLESGGRDL